METAYFFNALQRGCINFPVCHFLSSFFRGVFLSCCSGEFCIFSFLEEKMKQNTLYKPQPTKYRFFFHPSRFHFWLSWDNFCLFCFGCCICSMIGFCLKFNFSFFFLFSSWFITISFMFNHCVSFLVLLHL